MIKEGDLYTKLTDQYNENVSTLIGEFDGFSYSSKRIDAVFRTLEDMQEDDLITKDQYDYISHIYIK